MPRLTGTDRRALVRLVVTMISWHSVHSDECRLIVISVMENKPRLGKVCLGNNPLFGKSITFLFYFPVCWWNEVSFYLPYSRLAGFREDTTFVCKTRSSGWCFEWKERKLVPVRRRTQWKCRRLKAFSIDTTLRWSPHTPTIFTPDENEW